MLSMSVVSPSVVVTVPGPTVAVVGRGFFRGRPRGRFGIAAFAAALASRAALRSLRRCSFSASAAALAAAFSAAMAALAAAFSSAAFSLAIASATGEVAAADICVFMYMGLGSDVCLLTCEPISEEVVVCGRVNFSRGDLIENCEDIRCNAGCRCESITRVDVGQIGVEEFGVGGSRVTNIGRVEGSRCFPDADCAPTVVGGSGDGGCQNFQSQDGRVELCGSGSDLVAVGVSVA